MNEIFDYFAQRCPRWQLSYRATESGYGWCKLFVGGDSDELRSHNPDFASRATNHSVLGNLDQSIRDREWLCSHPADHLRLSSRQQILRQSLHPHISSKAFESQTRGFWMQGDTLAMPTLDSPVAQCLSRVFGRIESPIRDHRRLDSGRATQTPTWGAELLYALYEPSLCRT